MDVSVGPKDDSQNGYSEPCQTSKMEHFVKIGNGWIPLNIFAKRSTLDILQGSEYASASDKDYRKSSFSPTFT